MKCWQKSCIIVFYAIVLCAFSVFLSAFAYCQEEKDRKITEQEKKLQKIQAEINKYQEKVKEYSSEEKSVLTQLESLDLDLLLKNAELEKLNIDLQRLTTQIERITKEISELENTINELRNYIKNRLLSLYKLGRLAYFRYMLSLKNPADILSCYKYVAILSDRDAQKIENFRETMQLLTKSQQELVKSQRASLRVKTSLENKRNEIAKARRERQNYLQSIQEQRELYTKATDDLEQASQKLKLLIDSLRDGIEPSANPAFFLNITNFKGLLNWPINGTVVVSFGRVKHPKFNTYTIQNGVDIATNPGTLVNAVFAGKVLYADWFKTYGNLLIMDHQSGYWSFYAHLDEFLVETNQWVERDQPIAISGDTSSLRGFCLHFELRHNGIPLNPAEWLKKRNNK